MEENYSDLEFYCKRKGVTNFVETAARKERFVQNVRKLKNLTWVLLACGLTLSKYPLTLK